MCKLVKNLVKAGFNVNVAKGAGALSQFSDALYEAAGAKIVSDAEAFKADIVTKVPLPDIQPSREVGPPRRLRPRPPPSRSACPPKRRPPRSRIALSSPSSSRLRHAVLSRPLLDF